MAPYRPGPSWPKIKRRLRGYKNELVQLLRELTAIPALGPENGGEGEQAKARYLQKKLKALNPQRMISLSCADLRVPSKNRPNILALEQLPRWFKQQDRTFEPPISTFEPTKKEANVLNVNTIPGEDVFYLDCRVLPADSLKQVLERVQVMVSAVYRKTGARITYEVVNAVQAPPPPGGGLDDHPGNGPSAE